MKIAALALLALMVAATPLQEDVEAKKKRLGEIFSQLAKIEEYEKQLAQIAVMRKEMDAILDQLSGGNVEKREAIVLEVMEKHVPEMAKEMRRAQAATNERRASVTLKTVSTAEADFRANDRDGNQVNDFWVGDVSGLYRILANNEAIKLIEIATACADARPAVPSDAAGAAAVDAKTKYIAAGPASPKSGYHFAAIEKCQDGSGAFVKYDEGNGRNRSRFGFCAYPVQYPAMGKMTYVIDENNTLYRKDTGGRRVEQWSDNPAKDGWQKYD